VFADTTVRGLANLQTRHFADKWDYSQTTFLPGSYQVRPHLIPLEVTALPVASSRAEIIKSLVTSLILSRLDYSSSTLAGLPGYLLDRLQSVLNAAARLIHSESRAQIKKVTEIFKKTDENRTTGRTV